VGLLVLAGGLQQRLDAAYHMTAVLLSAGIVFSLFKGFDYEEALALSIMLGALVPCRQHFYRKASLFGERFTPEDSPRLLHPEYLQQFPAGIVRKADKIVAFANL